MRAPSLIAGVCVWITVAYGQGDSDLTRKYLDELKENPWGSLTHYLLQKLWTSELLAHLREVMRYERTDVPVSDMPGMPSPPPKIKSIVEIEDTTTHSPYSVVISAIISEDGVPENIDVIRGLAVEFNLTASRSNGSGNKSPRGTLTGGNRFQLDNSAPLDFNGLHPLLAVDH